METIPSAVAGPQAASLVVSPEAVPTSPIVTLPETVPPPQPSSQPPETSDRLRSVRPARAALVYSPQFNTIGGVETHLVRLSCVLAKQNWHVTLVTTSGMLEKTRVAELSAAGVEFIAPPGESALSVPRKAAWLASLVGTRLRRRHWDVIYTNAQGSLSWLLRPLKRRGTRLVHHYHTAGDERDEGTWGWLFPRWLSAVDEIVACSAATAQNLRRVLGDTTGRDGRDKLRVIRYLSTDVTPMPNPPVREPNGKLRFGFVGRLMRDKGIDVICRLSEDAALADIEWHIHGCGSDYDAAYFEKFPRVHYHGRYQGAAELSSILARLDALALFSIYQEGQPISLIEGMSAGLPWIATDQGGTRELMWSPTNCRLIGASCDYDEARCAVLDLAQAIRDGKTSFAAQRRAYDDHLAPATVGERWMEFLAQDTAPALQGGLLDNAFPAMKLPQL
jgi:glycosyltransferase involved in cell wall biosynthesis